MLLTSKVCPHIPYSRADLYNIVAIKQLKSFVEVMQAAGKNPNSLGCELCKPAIASILSSLFNPHIMDKGYNDLQDTNDKFLANIQRNGTFSVVPRIPGGEITADKLIAIGSVAKKYGLYCKITGAQRIDMFGAKKQDLLNIWTDLVDAGMESGHAYAKALRAIKVCLGITTSRKHLLTCNIELRWYDMVSFWNWRQCWYGHSPGGTVQEHPRTTQIQGCSLRLRSRVCRGSKQGVS